MMYRQQMTRIYGIVFTVLICLFFSSPLYADMGAIHVMQSDVTVSEPAQKAIILHNGAEEVLILETDLKASKKAEIVRFIPFPAEPRVSLAPENAIQEMSKLVKSKKLHYITYFQTKGGGGGTQNQPVAEVVSRAKLGAHDITVVKINDAQHFKSWVRNFFKEKKQLQKGPELQQVARVASDYVKDGIPFFVFDCVTIDKTDKSVAPVAFRFKSRKLYYPLRTSNTIGGKGDVQLFFLAIDCVRQPFNNGYRMYSPGEGEFSGFLFSTIAEVKPEEIASIYPEAAAFFDGRRIVLQCASFSGSLQFKRDINSFMLTHYVPGLYDTSGAVQTSASDPGEVLAGLDANRLRRPCPMWWKAEMLERQRRKIIASLTNSSFYLAPVAKEVQFHDGSYRDGSVRAETDRLAIGDLNGDGFADAAMITRIIRKSGETCELTAFTGKTAELYEGPALEPAGSIPLKSCEAVDFLIADKKIMVIEKGGLKETYKLVDGKLTPAR